MSEIPAPVDLSRLKGILGGAKAVMNKVAENDSRGGVTGMPQQSMNEGIGDKLLSADQLPQQAQMQAQTQRAPQKIGPVINENGQGMYAHLNSSKLPDSIKRAMIDNPIPQPDLASLTNTFTLDDVQDLIQTPAPAPQPRVMTESLQPQYQQKNDAITVSEAALRGIIKDVLLEFMSTTFTKNLSEEVIKKTISTLIKEGKIKATTKKVVK